MPRFHDDIAAAAPRRAGNPDLSLAVPPTGGEADRFTKPWPTLARTVQARNTEGAPVSGRQKALENLVDRLCGD